MDSLQSRSTLRMITKYRHSILLRRHFYITVHASFTYAILDKSTCTSIPVFSTYLSLQASSPLLRGRTAVALLISLHHHHPTIHTYSPARSTTRRSFPSRVTVKRPKNESLVQAASLLRVRTSQSSILTMAASFHLLVRKHKHKPMVSQKQAGGQSVAGSFIPLCCFRTHPTLSHSFYALRSLKPCLRI